MCQNLPPAFIENDCRSAEDEGDEREDYDGQKCPRWNVLFVGNVGNLDKSIRHAILGLKIIFYFWIFSTSSSSRRK